MELPPTEFAVMPRQDMPRNTDPRKRWSDTAARWMGMESGRKVEVGLTEVKKRWSSFGSNMLKMFDKLLVDEDPSAKVESPPWDEAPPPAPATTNPRVPAEPAREVRVSSPGAGPDMDWGGCETLVDIEQVLNEAPAGVQVWGVHHDGDVKRVTDEGVKLRRPQPTQRQQQPGTNTQTDSTQKDR